MSGWSWVAIGIAVVVPLGSALVMMLCNKKHL